MKIAAARSPADHRDRLWPLRDVARFAWVAGWLLAFVIVLLGWQLAVFLAFLGGVVQLGAYAELHFLGCLAFAAWPAWRLFRSDEDERMYRAADRWLGRHSQGRLAPLCRRLSRSPSR